MSQPPTRTSPPSKIYRFSSNLPGPSPLSDGIHLCNRCTVTTCRLWLLPRDLHHLRGRLGVKMLRKWKVIVARRDHAIMQYGYIIYICYFYILYLFTYLKFETLDNFDPPPPPTHTHPNFKVFNFFHGLGWVDKTNQTPQHQMSCALAWTLRFGERGGMSFFFSGFEYFVHLLYDGLQSLPYPNRIHIMAYVFNSYAQVNCGNMTHAYNA